MKFHFLLFLVTALAGFLSAPTALAQASKPEPMTAAKAKLIKELTGDFTVASCSFKKEVNGVEDTKVKPCDSKRVEIFYEAPADFFMNFYMYNLNPDGSKLYTFGRRAWVKHTGCLENPDSGATLCYDVNHGSWTENLKVRKNSCLSGEQDTTDLDWNIHKNSDGSISLAYTELIFGVYCNETPLLRQTVKNVMSLTLIK